MLLSGRPRLQKALFLLFIFGGVLLLTFYNISESRAIYKSINDAVDYKTEIIAVPLVYENASLYEEELLEEIEESASNLPVNFWRIHQKSGLKLNSSCARFPQLLDLQFNNDRWQTLVTSNGTFQLLNAYLDNRKYNEAGSTVRLLGMINTVLPNVTTYCQIWYEDQSYPIIVKSENYTYVWRREWMQFKVDQYEPHLISCNIPGNNVNNIPIAVSLVEKECNTATNLLKIIYKQVQDKKGFAVCVKGLDFPNADLTVRLVEWIELLNILGNSMIFFYTYNVHQNVTNLLNYYQQQGKVQVMPFQLAGTQPNLPALRSYYLKKKLYKKRISEVLTYNDCFYQHMYEYKYIALLDIDEIIIPGNVNTWNELIEEIQLNVTDERSAYSAQNLYFFDTESENKTFLGIPKYMHMLQHVHRSVNYTVTYYAKSFFNTEKVLTLHNHYPINCFHGCKAYNIEIKDAILHHYRADCVNDLKKSCSNIKDNLVMDTTIWRYKEHLIKHVTETLQKLGFF